jgi:hypothetical protein
MNRTRTILIYLGLGVLEATPAAILLAFWGAPGALLPMIVVVLGMAAVDVLAQRLLPAERQRAALAAGALLLSLWAAKALVSGAAGPAGGWGVLAEAFFGSDADLRGWVLLVLTIALYAAWRGSRLTLYENEGLRELFGRVMASTLVVVLLGSWTASSDDALRPEMGVVTGELVLGFATGLAAVALARRGDLGQADRPLGWRSLMSVMAAIGVILLLSLGLGALLGGDVAEILLQALGLVLSAVAFVLLPLLFLLLSAMAWILERLHVERAMGVLQQLARMLGQARLEPPKFLTDATAAMPWLGPLLDWAGRLLPAVLLLAAIYAMLRRRGRARQADEEERVSLFSWSMLADDLLGLLSGLRRRPATGLQAALARITGADPASRIRRAYIRMLIAAEARKLPRGEPQTAREYMPTAQAAFPGAPGPLGTLTRTYEQARYDPSGATDDDAAAAEQALGQLPRS